MSEIFVDTIRKTGGSLGTDIRVKNTSVYESDGGTSVTQNLVQGINKAWVNFNGTGTIATRDSFNVASLVDDSTGDYQINFTNNMGNVNYSMVSSGTHDGGSYFATGLIDSDAGHLTTSAYYINYMDHTDNKRDTEFCMESVLGDLA